MKENLAACLDKIGLSEAGFSNHPDDPGGPTNHGITQRTLEAWRKRAVSIDDVKALTEDEARDILASQDATPVRFDDLPSGLDYAILDASVNSGPDRAARILQQTLGMPEVAVDGIIGAHTLAELRDYPDVRELIEAYCEARLDFCKTLENWGTFGKGWTIRIQRVQADAVAMASGRATLADAPALPPEAQAKAGGAVKVTATRSGRAAIVNVATAAVAAVVSVGAAASQAISVLQPYANIAMIRNTIISLTVISAAGTLIVAMQRAKGGGTT